MNRNQFVIVSGGDISLNLSNVSLRRSKQTLTPNTTTKIPDITVMEAVCDGEEPEVVTQACLLSEFSEKGEARALINSLPDIHHDPVSREATIEKFVGKTVCHVYDSGWLAVHKAVFY